jgi:hypothetical protein
MFTSQNEWVNNLGYFHILGRKEVTNHLPKMYGQCIKLFLTSSNE